MEKLRALVRFLPNLTDPGFSAGSWVGPEKTAPSTFIMPYTLHSDIVREFVDAAYQNGWVRSDFDWPDWVQTDEAIRLRADEAALAVATYDQLGKLLTVCIRQDRFCEGALLADFENGLILRIVRRARQLLNADEGD